MRGKIRNTIGMVLVAAIANLVLASDDGKAKQSANSDPLTAQFFGMIEDGTIDVRLLPKMQRGSESIKLHVSNPSTSPLTIQLPPSLVAMPVLAQQQQPPQPLGMGMPTGPFPQNGNRFGNNGLNNNQFNGRMGFPLLLEQRLFEPKGLRGNDGGKPGPLFRTVFERAPFQNRSELEVPPGKTVKLNLPTVCLKYGDPDPSPRYKYELKPLSEVTDSLPLRQALWLNANGFFNQPMTQAVAWHEMNGLSWTKLQGMRRQRSGNNSEPFFTYDELVVARRLVESPKQAVATTLLTR